MYYYDQIVEKEKNWSSLIEKGLINVYSLKCSGGIRDFYISKIRELNGYLSSDQSPEIKKMVKNLENIVNKIDIIIARHINNEKYSISEITKYFLINIDDNQIITTDDVDKNEIKSEVLKAVSNYYKMNIPPMEKISID